MAESLIYDLCKVVGSKLLEEGRLLTGVPEEALEMGRKLKRIEAVQKVAEQREIEAGVKEWICELKDVAYDIEDVLDDWSIAQLEGQDKSISVGCLSCIPSSLHFCCKRHGIAHAIIEINKRLDGIDERKQKFNFPTTITSNSEGPKRESSTSYGYHTDVVSQKNFKAEVIKKLVDSGFKGSVADRIPIISIFGIGGLGKTTVARLVYEDETVKKHFPQKIAWVCVSNNFDATNVAKAIYHELSGKSADESVLQSVLTEIEKFICGTKFLLVLDDVWETSDIEWNPILKCLSKGDTRGSRILMTSRDSNFSPTMRVDIVPMNKLSEAEAMSLFSYYAFPGDPDHRGEVEAIAVQLVKKCDGLPLALQVLGSHMATKTTLREWNDVVLSKMWETQFQEKVFNSLAFSYLELRSEAKRCFVFCSVFPKDTDMEKNELIHLWMAQGYLKGTNHMEVLGEECFASLLRRSFFQVSKSYSDEDTYIRVRMHDLVHDFAQYISNDDVAILDPSNVTKGNAQLRHLAFSREMSESECQLSSLNHKALRTLFVCTYNSSAILDGLSSNKSYIRALDIQVRCGPKMFDGYDFRNIGKLIHLRYLRLSCMIFPVLPVEICRLPYLQTLDLSRCLNPLKLPEDIGHLTTLRHLLLSGNIRSLPKGLGKLSSLQTLSLFICGDHANEDCCSLEDLRDLNNLRGDLMLINLNSVANVDEATRAALYKKTQIHGLELYFGDGDASLQSEVLEALRPATENMVFLEIGMYRGKAYPPWIGQMRCLKKVKLCDVSVEFLPELGTLRFLEELIVNEATEVRRVGAEIYGKVEQGQAFFPKLKSLQFSDMSNWEHWDCPEEIMRSGVTVMPSLRGLEICTCIALQTLPRFLEHVPLESFKVDSDHLPPVDLAEYAYPKQMRIGDILLPQTLKKIDTPFMKLSEEESFQPEASQVVQQQHLNFTYLDIHENYGLSTITIPAWIVNLAYLRVIRLSDFEDVWLPPLGSLACLEELTIWNAKKVEKVGDEFLGNHSGRGESTVPFIVFPRLKKLSFRCMPAWREWEDSVHGNDLTIMPSLCDLTINECKMLKSLPHFFECVPLKKLHVTATEEGDMLKIRNTSTREDEPANYEMIKEITLEGVTNKWLLDWAKYCVRLRELRLMKCAEASYVGQLEVSLPSLETLHVSACDFKRLGMEMLRISSLNELHFSHMPDWEEWDDASPHQPEIISDESRELSQHGNNDSSIINFTSNLCVLFLFDCPKLKALPSFLRSVRSLKKLEIMMCDALKTWWETEADEDWREWMSNIPTVYFEQILVKRGRQNYYF